MLTWTKQQGGAAASHGGQGKEGAPGRVIGEGEEDLNDENGLDGASRGGQLAVPPWCLVTRSGGAQTGWLCFYKYEQTHKP